MSDNVTYDCIYSSDTESVATVDENGIVTAVADGDATVTATYNVDSATTKTVNIPVHVGALPTAAFVGHTTGANSSAFDVAYPNGSQPGNLCVVLYFRGESAQHSQVIEIPDGWDVAADQVYADANGWGNDVVAYSKILTPDDVPTNGANDQFHVPAPTVACNYISVHLFVFSDAQVNSGGAVATSFTPGYGTFTEPTFLINGFGLVTTSLASVQAPWLSSLLTSDHSGNGSGTAGYWFVDAGDSAPAHEFTYSGSVYSGGGKIVLTVEVVTAGSGGGGL